MEALKVVLVGAGNRASVYSQLSLHKPEKMQIVGIVEPNPIRSEIIREKFNVPAENCMASLDEFLAREKFADAVINGTMDQLHVQTSIPVLEKGYDLLLEKPFCTNEADMEKLREAAKRTGRKVMICHVLRCGKLDDTDLLAVRTDQSDFICANLLIDLQLFCANNQAPPFDN